MPREAESSHSFLQVTQAAPVFKVVTTPSTISSFLSFFFLSPDWCAGLAQVDPLFHLCVYVLVGWGGGDAYSVRLDSFANIVISEGHSWQCPAYVESELASLK